MGAPTKLIVTGVVLFLFGAIFGFWGFQKFLYYKIGQNVGLRKGGEMRTNWEKAPIPVEFRIYLFNLTNPNEVAEGAKPIVNEIGPYFFDEWKAKAKFEDNSTEDTVSFHMKTSWVFQPSRSDGLTGDEIITIPHPALMSMVLTVEKDKPGALSMLAKALPPLFNFPTTPFLTAKAMDILFNGIPINCTSKEFGPKAVCTMIKANPKGLKRQGEDIFLFSFFGMKNGTVDEGKFTVKRGIVNPLEVGTVIRFNDEPKMKMWSGDPCNDFTGTDSTIFPPFRTPSDEITAYSPDLCRSLGAKFERFVVYKGIAGNRYTAKLGDMSRNEDEKCFCPSPSTCLKKGAFDVSKCVGAPIILTLPHFYDAEEYLTEVDGLRPEQDKHEIFMNFEPITATPLGARKRLQFNIRVHAIPKVPLMKNLPLALIPLFWVEEGLELDQSWIDLLDARLFRTIRIVGISKWVLMLVGILMVCGGVYLQQQRQGKGTITNEAPANGKTVRVESLSPKF